MDAKGHRTLSHLELLSGPKTKKSFKQYDLIHLQTMDIRVTVLSLIFLYVQNISSSCDHVFSKRFSKEYIILKNETLEIRAECLSGVVLQSKFDGLFYCVAKNQNVSKAENMTCMAQTKLKTRSMQTQEDCQCGIENPPPSSTNRIMYPTGMKKHSLK